MTTDAQDLMEAARTALVELAKIREAVNEHLDHEHFLALSDAQQTLALAYTRAGGEPIKGICQMCGQPFSEGPDLKGPICGYCERSYGPADDE
jgi:rubrerythrin